MSNVDSNPDTPDQSSDIYRAPKFVQIVSHEYCTLALDSDGVIWLKRDETNARWERYGSRAECGGRGQ